MHVLWSMAHKQAAWLKLSMEQYVVLLCCDHKKSLFQSLILKKCCVESQRGFVLETGHLSVMTKYSTASLIQPLMSRRLFSFFPLWFTQIWNTREKSCSLTWVVFRCGKDSESFFTQISCFPRGNRTSVYMLFIVGLKNIRRKLLDAEATLMACLPGHPSHHGPHLLCIKLALPLGKNYRPTFLT